MKKGIFCFNESTGTCNSNEDLLRELCRGKCPKLIAMFYLVKTSIDTCILGSEKCKVIFGFKYIRPTFPSKADKIAEPRPDMNINRFLRIHVFKKSV